MKFTERLRRRKSATSTSEQLTLDGLLNWLGVHDVERGVQSEATYYACLKVLSEALGKLPLRLMQTTADTGVQPLLSHRYYRVLLERPNRFMSASVFWTYIERCRNHNGNGYAIIDEHDPEHPQLWPMDPDKVMVYYDDGRKVLNDVTDVYYVYNTPDGPVTFSSDEVLHFKAHQTVDGIVGVPVQEQLANTIRGNVKAQDLVNKMYDNGMTAKAVLQYTGGLDDAKVEALVKGVEAYAAGKLKERGVENIIPLPVGMTLTPLSVKLADSQFIEVKQYSALQIAAAFGVKPYQIGDYTKSSYASAEAQQLSFLIDTLLFNIKQYEEEISWKLLSDAEAQQGITAKFNTSVLLRTEFQTLVTTLSTAVQSFLFTPNEARERLDLPHVDGGDQLLGNGNAIPVQYAGVQYTSGSGAPAGATTIREEEKVWIKEIISDTMKDLLG